MNVNTRTGVPGESTTCELVATMTQGQVLGKAARHGAQVRVLVITPATVRFRLDIDPDHTQLWLPFVREIFDDLGPASQTFLVMRLLDMCRASEEGQS